MKPMTKTFLLLCLASTALAVPAMAENVPPVVAVLLHNFEVQAKVKPTYATVETDAKGNIAITKLAFGKAAEAGGPAVSVAIDEVDLEDVSDAGNGLYQIGSATVTGMKLDVTGANGQAFSVSMPEGSAEDWYIKDAGASPTPADALRASMNVAKKMSSGKITATAMGQTITADGYDTTWDGDPATGAGSFTAKLGNVVIPESAIAIMDTSGMLKQLGYSSLSFDIDGDGKLDIAGDKMGLAFNFAYVGKDMGTLRFSVGAGDIPLAVYAELQKSQEGGKQPDFAALMPELQNVTLAGFTFRFEDASITKKVLPLIAKMQGMDEATMVASAGAMAQMGLMSLNNQEFTTQVVGAINAFLKEPKSITVALKPAAPIKVQELMTLNPANPGEAIAKLGVSVSAND